MQKTREWIHRRPWLRLIGKEWCDYSTPDMLGLAIHICTRCGCHFNSSKCPSDHVRRMYHAHAYTAQHSKGIM
jgi:hypothetical protein